MRLINLPIDLLQTFNPRDENFPELKADAEAYEAKIDREFKELSSNDKPISGGLKLQKVIFDYNKNWFVRVLCGFVYIFLKKSITDYLRGVDDNDEQDEDISDEELYAQFLHFKKVNKIK